MAMAGIIAVLIASAAMATTAQAQHEAIFDEHGRITERSATDSTVFFSAEDHGPRDDRQPCRHPDL